MGEEEDKVGVGEEDKVRVREEEDKVGVREEEDNSYRLKRLPTVNYVVKFCEYIRPPAL